MSYEVKRLAGLLSIFALLLAVSVAVALPSGNSSLPYSDDFENGLTNDWSPVNGTWTVQSGELHQTSPSRGVIVNREASADKLNYSVQVETFSSNGSTGVLLRSGDEGKEAVETVLDFDTDTVQLVTVRNGSRKVINSTDTAEPLNSRALLKTAVRQSTVTVSVNGDQVLRESNQNFSFTGRHIGLTSEGEAVFDNFTVEKTYPPRTTEVRGRIVTGNNSTAPEVRLLDSGKETVDTVNGSKFRFDARENWFIQVTNRETEIQFPVNRNFTDLEIPLKTGASAVPEAPGQRVTGLNIDASEALGPVETSFPYNASLNASELSMWTLRNDRWRHEAVHLRNGSAETAVNPGSIHALTKTYLDKFDRENLSRDWVTSGGYWYLSDGYLVMSTPTPDPGAAVNLNASTGYRDAEVSTEFTMAGEDKHYMSLLLRSTRNGSEAVEIRLDWRNDTATVGVTRNGYFDPVETVNVTKATDGSMSLHPVLDSYRVDAKIRSDEVFVKIGAGSESVEFGAESREFVNVSGGYVGVKGRNGGDNRNLFNNFTYEPLPPRRVEVTGNVTDGKKPVKNGSTSISKPDGVQWLHTGNASFNYSVRTKWFLETSNHGDGVSAEFRLNRSSVGAETVLKQVENNPVMPMYPDGLPVKFVNISTKNLSFTDASTSIRYSDEDLRNIDEDSLTVWRFGETGWVQLSTENFPNRNTVKADLPPRNKSVLAVTGDYVDRFNDETISKDWFINHGAFTEKNGSLTLNSDGLILNHRASDHTQDYRATATVEKEVDEGNVSILLRSDATGQSGVKAVLDFGNDSARIEQVDREGVETLAENNVSLTNDTEYVFAASTLFDQAKVFVNGSRILKASNRSLVLNNHFIGLQSDTGAEFHRFETRYISRGRGPVHISGRVIDLDHRLIRTAAAEFTSRNGSVVKKRLGPIFSMAGNKDWFFNIDAEDEKGVEAGFRLARNASSAEIVLDQYGDNPIGAEPPGYDPVKYVEIGAENVPYREVRVRIHYDENSLGKLRERHLVIRHYRNGEWLSIPTEVNEEKNYVEAFVTHLSPFAVTGSVKLQQGPPEPYKLRVWTNRYVVLDDPVKGDASPDFYNVPNSKSWGGGKDWWNNESTELKMYAAVLDQYGEPLSGETVNFTVTDWNDLPVYNISTVTGSDGVANTSINLNGSSRYGQWNVSAETGSITAKQGFVYNWWGCANCHDERNVTNISNPGYKRSPYVNGHDGVHSTDSMENRTDDARCTECHQSYGGTDIAKDQSSGGQYPWGMHRNHSRCQDCHTPDGNATWLGSGGGDGNGLPEMPSCFSNGCHSSSNHRVKPWRTTDPENRSIYSWIWVENGSQDSGTSLRSHGVNNTGGEGVPCTGCHGAMHKVTTPQPNMSGDGDTENQQCTQCHIETQHLYFNNSVEKDCTKCHTQDAHNVSGTNRYFNHTASNKYDLNRNTKYVDDPAWGTWQRWELSYNHSYNATGVESETCEACHAGPNQPGGVHRIDLNFTVENANYYTWFGWSGDGLKCSGCHDSNTDNGEQELHSAHPASFNASTEPCGCHDDTFASIPKQSVTNGTYTVNVFGTDQVYDASNQQTCQQCHPGWHRDPVYNESLYPSLSQGLDETLQPSNETNVTGTGAAAPGSPVPSNVAPGVKGKKSCTDTPCHTRDAHQSMEPAVSGDRFPGLNNSTSSGCDECHSTQNWGNHVESLTDLYSNEQTNLSIKSGCDMCHFEAQRDEGLLTTLYNIFE